MITFKGVHKWFNKLHVLNDINLHVTPGEVLVVCGPSGSGKSTLIRTVNKLELINDGYQAWHRLYQAGVHNGRTGTGRTANLSELQINHG